MSLSIPYQKLYTLGLDRHNYQAKHFLMALMIFVCTILSCITLVAFQPIANTIDMMVDSQSIWSLNQNQQTYQGFGLMALLMCLTVAFMFLAEEKIDKGNLYIIVFRDAVVRGIIIAIAIDLILSFVLSQTLYAQQGLSTSGFFNAYWTISKFKFIMVFVAFAVAYVLSQMEQYQSQHNGIWQYCLGKILALRTTVIALVVLWLLNALIVLVANFILARDRSDLFQFLVNDYNIIHANNGMALLFGFLIIVSCALFIGCVFVRNQTSRIIMIFPATVLFGAIFSNLIYFLLNGGDLVLSPLYIFTLYFAEQTNQHYYLMSCGIGFLMAFVFPVGLVLKSYTSNNKIHGGARFANYFDLLKYKMFKRSQEALFLGMWYGKALFANGFEHVLFLGPSGSGKSTTYGIINIMEWQGSTVNNDLSSELYNKTSRYCREVKGNEVYRLAPLDRQIKTHRWNIYHDVCKLDKVQRYGELSRIAALIVPNSGGKDDSWTNAARNGIECVSAYLISVTGYCTLGEIAEICARGDFDAWLGQELKNPDTDEQFQIRANAYLSIQATETRSGVKFNMDAYLGLYLNPIVRAATSFSDFSLADLRRKKMDVFFCIPQGQMQTISPLVTMFWEELTYQMTLNEPKKDEPYAVFCNIDETGNMGRLNNLRTGASYLRKYRLRITYYFQYFRQSGDLYSDKEMAAFLNTKTKILFTPSDDHDIEAISKMSGRTTKKYRTKSRQTGSTHATVTEHFEKRNLLEYNDIKYMSENRLLIQVDAKYTIKATKKYYFKDIQYKGVRTLEVDYEFDNALPIQAAILPKILNPIEVDGPLEDDLRLQALAHRNDMKEKNNVDSFDTNTGQVQDSNDKTIETNNHNQPENDEGWNN